MGTFSFFCRCFILSWVEVGRNRQISIFFTLTDMIASDGFYLAQVYCIIHNRIPIVKWMNVTIHSKHLHIKWQSLSHCLLYVKEISAKLAVAWHNYISQFAKDSHSLTAIQSQQYHLNFYCTACCCHAVLSGFCCCCCYFCKSHEILWSKTHYQLSSVAVSFSDKQWTVRRVHLYINT